ncbi:acyl carrier protein [Aliikangiella sp. IMCC44359]|uniref:acyl carrier protein n=1 Tax=Aliikangiella sp. IMCC44359 TaxID=3459125 RepID=UPI00403AF01F
MVLAERLKQLLADVLQIETDYICHDTLLLGHLPEFDSMAVMRVILELESTFSFLIDDDEIAAENFESFASLLTFVQDKKLFELTEN